MKLAVVYGNGGLAPYGRNLIPAKVPGIDIRIHPSASGEAINGRDVIAVDAVNIDKIIEAAVTNKVTHLLICGGGSRFNAIWQAGPALIHQFWHLSCLDQSYNGGFVHIF